MCEPVKLTHLACIQAMTHSPYSTPIALLITNNSTAWVNITSHTNFDFCCLFLWTYHHRNLWIPSPLSKPLLIYKHLKQTFFTFHILCLVLWFVVWFEMCITRPVKMKNMGKAYWPTNDWQANGREMTASVILHLKQTAHCHPNCSSVALTEQWKVNQFNLFFC